MQIDKEGWRGREPVSSVPLVQCQLGLARRFKDQQKETGKKTMAEAAASWRRPQVNTRNKRARPDFKKIATTRKQDALNITLKYGLARLFWILSRSASPAPFPLPRANDDSRRLSPSPGEDRQHASVLRPAPRVVRMRAARAGGWTPGP